MLTLPVEITQSELTAKLDKAIASKARRVNRWEPTFGQRIASAVLSPNYQGWQDMKPLQSISTTGVRSARANGYYRSEVINGERQIYMTDRQARRAWDVLARYEMVGDAAVARIQRYRKQDALVMQLDTYIDDIHVNTTEIAELILTAMEACAAGDVRRDYPLPASSYLPNIRLALESHTFASTAMQTEIIDHVMSLMELLVAFHADFAK